MAASKGREGLSRNDLRLALEWLGFGHALGPWFSLPELLLNEFIEFVVRERVPERNFPAAYLTFSEKHRLHIPFSEPQFKARYLERLPAKSTPRRISRIVKAWLPDPEETLVPLPRVSDEIFQLYVDFCRVYYRLKDPQWIAKLRRASLLPAKRPFLFFTWFHDDYDQLVITDHQPIVLTDHALAAKLPEIDKFIRSIPLLCLDLFERHAQEIADAQRKIQDDTGGSIDSIRIPSTGHMMMDWEEKPQSATAIYYGAHLPQQAGYRLDRSPQPWWGLKFCDHYFCGYYTWQKMLIRRAA